METIINFIQDYNWVLVLALIALVIVLIIIEIINRVEYNRLERRYKKLMRGTTGKNIEELIYDFTGKIENSLDDISNLKENVNILNNKFKKSIQKYSIIRYRAFEDVGSDLSFSIALLNENDDGVIITGIYGRNESTCFAKPVENGLSKYELSEEEKQVVKNAINGIMVTK
ncbi:MAG TPA: DUF4446 domain-containing protein [Clostridiaceae bacterium]|nr:DUF4446 domain-containing protein [Clostridiaceae bacterium]